MIPSTFSGPGDTDRCENPKLYSYVTRMVNSAASIDDSLYMYFQPVQAIRIDAEIPSFIFMWYEWLILQWV